MRRRALMTAILTLPLARWAHAARASGGKPMRRCTVHDAATLAALRAGRKRLAIVVRSFAPRAPVSAAIVVHIVGPDSASRREIARFGLHPPRAFGKGSEPQRFMVSLEPHAASIREGEALCIEAGFAAGARAVAGGTADIDIEVVDLPGKP